MFAVGCSSSSGSNETDGGSGDGSGGETEGPEEGQVGGEVHGLSSGGLILTLNDEESFEIEESGPFSFESTIAVDDEYSVALDAQPASQHCELENATGTMPEGGVDDIAVHCYAAPELSASSDIMQMHVHWSGPGTVDIFYSSDADCDWEAYSNCSDSGAIMQAEGGSVTLESIADGFDVDTPWYFIAEYQGMQSQRVAARGATPAFSDWTTDTIIQDGRLYVSGGFRHVGLQASGGAPIHAETGQPHGPLPAFGPDADAEVRAAVPDGVGGWFIAGTFDSVDGLDRTGLARIRPDGGVDTDWAFHPDQAVETLLVHEGKLFVGGRFAEIEVDGVTHSREHVAIIDLDEGELLNEPEISTDERVEAFAAVGERLFIGGRFELVNGVSKDVLAAVDLSDGSVDEDWGPDVFRGTGTPIVEGLLVDDGAVFVRGRFDEVNDAERNGFGVVDAGGVGANLGYWDVITDRRVESFALSEDTLYLGGRFREINGVERDYLAAFDLSSRSMREGFLAQTDRRITQVAVVGDRLVASGGFDRVGHGPNDDIEWQLTPTLAAFDADSGVPLSDWHSGITRGNEPRVLVGNGEHLYVGGDFRSIGGVPREYLAAFDLESGLLDRDWRPELGGGEWTSVEAMAIHGERLYLGGWWDEDAEVDHEGLLAVKLSDASVDENWQASVGDGGVVRQLAVTDERVFVGGGFSDPEGHSTENVAAFFHGQGGVDSGWSAAPSSNVNTLIAHGDRLYIGGHFNNVGGVDRSRLAALEQDDGSLVDEWAPAADNTVEVLLAHDNMIYIGGRFEEVRGDTGVDPQFETREGLAALDAQDGGLDADWRPGIRRNSHGSAGSANGIAIGGDGQLYVTGGILFAGSPNEDPDAHPRDWLAAFDMEEATLNHDWNPGLDGSGYHVSAHDDVVIVLGADETGDTLRGGLMLFDAHSGELIW
ncbi:hypothetical protein J2T60_002330 [Natronospira proteinivora]|uniref:N-acetylneuraminate epimerase n=1 Tax=Natronospira proteinivora TaxID=1807133 RepID=A0ABT1GAH6_9GAMM|nr:hypothetical protein [Natronospira proteinivora]MCP1728330.1 hypothetical protein [Natronospira proteinivora]